MANVYAIKTGNWSDITLWNTGALPTSADDVFSNNFTVTIDVDVTVLSIRNTAQSPAVAGGGFILSGSNLTVSATGGGFVTGATRLIDYTGSDCVLNGNVIGSTTTNVQSVYHNSTGTLTINGNVVYTVTTSIVVISTNSTGTLNINGLIDNRGRDTTILIASVCTVNIVGNLVRASPFSGGSLLNITAGATVNITGNVINNSVGNFSPGILVNSSFCILNITGDVIQNSNTSSNDVIIVNQPARVYIVGSLYNNITPSITLRSSTNLFLSIIGTIKAQSNQVVVVSTNSSAINLFSGPFICSEYGFFPYQCVRMHLIPSAASYIEFRDETTNGALSPGPVAPATQLISPSTLVSNLAIADVRFGTVYAMGTLTGTLRMPTPNQVTFGVAVDDTFGNSVLTAASVWDYLVSNITVEGSIGMRLKNVATPQTIGEQLEAFLRLD
jgi:hypothetical protein